MDDIMRQNPDLMRSFQTAAVQSMSEKSPGFSGFVNGIMGDMNRGPPAPIRTQEVEEPNIDIKSMRKFMKPDTSFFETTGKPMSTAGLLHRISKMVEK